MAHNPNLKCRNCGSSHTICYGTYTRSVVDRGKIKKNVKIRRVHCHDCKETHGVLPKGLQKRKKYTDEAQKEMVESKYWYEGGLRKVGGPLWDTVRYPATTVWRAIQKAGPKSREATEALNPQFYGNLGVDEKYFDCKGGVGVWVAVMELFEIDKAVYGVVVAEDVLYIPLNEEMRKDKRKFRRVFRSEEREFVKGLLAKAGAKFGADSVELVVTDDDNIFPGVVGELFPSARHQICVKHICSRIGRAFRKEFGSKMSDEVKVLREKLSSILSVESWDDVERLFKEVLAQKHLLKKGGKVMRLIKYMWRERKRIFAFIESNFSAVNNALEQLFSRADPLYEIVKSFQSREGMRNFLSNLAMYLNTAPFVDGDHRGMSPLELAGMAVGKTPFWYL